jgi:adapter protein MecA 1/2
MLGVVTMKLERLSENQIRCTLNKTDLAERELKISELAYGTEKAKDLFREMMQQASYEFGFEAEDIPLMIEAIPVSADCIILVITKVEDPEELDTRFSKFTPSNDSEEPTDADFGDDDISALFSKIQEIRDSIELNEEDIAKVEHIEGTPRNQNQDDFVPFKDTLKKAKTQKQKDSGTNPAASDDASARVTRIFSFGSLDQVADACSRVTGYDDTTSSLYKNTDKSAYYLVVTYDAGTTDEFNRVSSSLCEFASRVKASYATESYYKEHYETIIKADAIKILARM